MAYTYLTPQTYPTNFGRSVRFGYEEINVNQSANTSDIKWVLVGYNRVADSTGFYYAGPFNATLNGREIVNNLYPEGSRLELANGTVIASGTLANVKHTTDGSKTVSVEWSCDYIYDATQTVAGSRTFNLTQIPRQSSMVVTGGTFGEELRVEVTSNGSTYTNNLTITCGSNTATGTVTGSGTYIMPGTSTQNWANAAPSSDSATLTVELKTYDGATQIGTTVTQSITMVVPQNWRPSTTIIQKTIVDGYNSQCLQNRSKVTVQVGATASAGSSVTSVTISGHGMNKTKTSSPWTLTSDVLSISGTITWTITVKDARGRSYTTTTTQTVTAYKLPTVTLDVRRCNSDSTPNDLGNYFFATIKATYKQIGSSNYSVTLKQSGTTKQTWSSQTTTPKTFTSSAYTASSNVSYTISATITDSVGSTVTVSTKLSTAEVLMDLSSDGVAFGGTADTSQAVRVRSGWDLSVESGDLIVQNKNIMDLLFYKAETVSWTGNLILAGVANTASNMRFHLQVGKSLANVSAVAVQAMTGTVYCNGAYVTGSSGVNLATTFTCTAEISSDYSIRLNLAGSATNLTTRRNLIASITAMTLKFT